MFNISTFLEKFSKNIQSNENQKQQIIEIIKNQTNITLKEVDIEIKNNIIYTNSSTAIKNKIFIFKNKIIENINLSSQIKILDIR